jgi:GT2 family glycosyltransferase
MTKKFIARPMNDVSLFNSQVDIIVPYYGQYEKVTQLLETIFRLTRSNYYHVYVIDDCSPNPQYIQNINLNAIKNAERSRQPNIIHTHRNEEQKGFAGACKVGFEMGESPYVCFINSDCLIKDVGWLRHMGESLLKLKSENVRVIVPTTNNPVGGDPAQQADGNVINSDDVIVADDSYLSLYCFMCHRQLFSKIGGFLKEYPYGGYEDQEFAHRLRHHGFKQGISKKSWVYHEGEATMKTIMRNSPEVVETIEKNREKCIEDMKNLKS